MPMRMRLVGAATRVAGALRAGPGLFFAIPDAATTSTSVARGTGPVPTHHKKTCNPGRREGAKALALAPALDFSGLETNECLFL